jgi:hypothetical protein
MEVGQVLAIPTKKDGSLTIVTVRKIFKDGSIWLEGKDVNMIVKPKELERLLEKKNC